MNKNRRLQMTYPHLPPFPPSPFTLTSLHSHLPPLHFLPSLHSTYSLHSTSSLHSPPSILTSLHFHLSLHSPPSTLTFLHSHLLPPLSPPSTLNYLHSHLLTPPYLILVSPSPYIPPILPPLLSSLPRFFLPSLPSSLYPSLPPLLSLSLPPSLLSFPSLNSLWCILSITMDRAKITLSPSNIMASHTRRASWNGT